MNAQQNLSKFSVESRDVFEKGSEGCQKSFRELKKVLRRVFIEFQVSALIALPPSDTLLLCNDIIVTVMYFHFNLL